jgi:ribosomal protein S18 acetylase RimI-like enzyme
MIPTATTDKEETIMTVPISDTATLEGGLLVRKATGQDLPAVVETLTAAFFDDPVMSWWVLDPARRSEILRAFFEIIVDVNHPHDELYTTSTVPAAAAVWVPTGCQPSGQDAERLVARCVDAAEETSERLLAAFELMNQHHPQQPHAYLFLLGTRPQWQSRGLGSALLREVLERCDRDATPAYLEASSEGSKQLYLRHGFEVTGEIPLPDGPSFWPMWREPR